MFWWSMAGIEMVYYLRSIKDIIVLGSMLDL